MSGYKRCNKCGCEKLIDDFYKEKNGRLFSKCKKCCADYYLENKEHRKKYYHEKWLKNPRHNPQWKTTDCINEQGQHARKCKTCGEIKQLEMFDKHPSCRNGRRSVCKICSLSKAKEKKALNREKHKERSKLNGIKNRYGLLPEKYLAMVKEQNNKCAICGDKMNIPCVDHCHNKGHVRGLLCNNCNSLLGMARESVGILENAIKYLENHK